MGKKPRNKKIKQLKEPEQCKDDGTRWRVVAADDSVVREGQPIYTGQGVIKGVAEKLSNALVTPSRIEQVS